MKSVIVVLQGELAVAAQAAGEIARLGAVRSSATVCATVRRMGYGTQDVLAQSSAKTNLMEVLDNVSMASERFDRMLKLIADRQS